MKLQYFFLIFLFSRLLFSQTPDVTPPDIYKQVLPGIKNEEIQQSDSLDEVNTFKEKKSEDNNQNQDVSITEEKLSLKEFLENKTLVNLVVLILIFLIFLFYRYRR